MSGDRRRGRSHAFDPSRRNLLRSGLATAGLWTFGQGPCSPAPTRAAQTPQSGPGSLPRFTEVSRQSGIHFTLLSGNRQKRKIIESLAGGVAWIDYNNDGYPDLLLVNSTSWEDWRAGGSTGCRLYRNNRDGSFTDVTARAGLKRAGWGLGVAVGDYDNDGYDDLYITCYGGNALYHTLLLLSRPPRLLRTTRAAGRTRHPLSQQRRRHLHGRHRARRHRSAGLLRPGCALDGL
ncbi:MAG: hypothetical protein DMG23_15725 [Acidobacteria bacterium]|nr:MAG: hypothetical protein DMG23_15725 [Acidobacteriota bacterium]